MKWHTDEIFTRQNQYEFLVLFSVWTSYNVYAIHDSWTYLENVYKIGFVYTDTLKYKYKLAIIIDRGCESIKIMKTLLLQYVFVYVCLNSFHNQNIIFNKVHTI